MYNSKKIDKGLHGLLQNNVKYFLVNNNSGYPTANYFGYPQVSGFVLRDDNEKNSADKVIREYEF